MKAAPPSPNQIWTAVTDFSFKTSANSILAKESIFIHYHQGLPTAYIPLIILPAIPISNHSWLVLLTAPSVHTEENVIYEFILIFPAGPSLSCSSYLYSLSDGGGADVQLLLGFIQNSMQHSSVVSISCFVESKYATLQ